MKKRATVGLLPTDMQAWKKQAYVVDIAGVEPGRRGRPQNHNFVIVSNTFECFPKKIGRACGEYLIGMLGACTYGVSHGAHIDSSGLTPELT